MTAPALAAQRFGVACLMGCSLGIWYGFLRPLRPRRTLLSDLLFVLGAVWVWLRLGFGVCKGDLRLGYTAGLFAGAFVWELLPGRWLRPLFAAFWKTMGKTWRLLLLPAKKFLKKVKILFASAEKWVTIKWNNRRQNRRVSGGAFHGRTKKSLPQNQSRRSTQPPVAEDHRHSGHFVVYGSAGSPELGAKRHPGTDG